MTGILGKKLGMTRIIKDDGRVIPTTVVECEPNTIAQIKTVEKDGYPAIVLGFCKLAKPTKTKKYSHLKEFKVADPSQFKKDEALTVEQFKEGEMVSVTGISKGLGFQGVVKRHGMKGGPASHGSHFKREPGSVGARAKPGRILRGKRMAGRMGTDTITEKLEIVYIDTKKNLIGVKGAVPGANKGLIIIKKLS